MKKKFKILTLGCKTNQYESQAFSDQLKGLGLISSAEDDDLDICIINACSVTKNADKRSLNAIKFLKKKNPKAKFFLTGCLSNGVHPSLNADITIVPNQKKHDLVSYIFPNRVVPKFSIKMFENHTRAFVKVHDGCDSYCTYCIIPKTRGRSRSRGQKEILLEISNLVDNGYKEIVLTGINIGKYKTLQATFFDLLENINEIPGVEKIKISSIDPIDITDEIIDLVVKSNKFIKTLHLVLQSGSDKILKKMNRQYTTEIFLEKVKKLKELCPDFTFTTDIIVGFPYETSEDFENSLKIVEDVQFQKVHIFPYSERPGTPAVNYKEKVDKDTINKRKNILNQKALETAKNNREKFIGRKMPVLFEQAKGDLCFGYTQNNLLVAVSKCEFIKLNTIHEIQLIKNTDEDYLLGEK